MTPEKKMTKLMTVTILYNPKCGTCRTVAERVDAKGH
jgi:arsenate reductase-like glutaredoxin family protein